MAFYKLGNATSAVRTYSGFKIEYTLIKVHLAKYLKKKKLKALINFAMLLFYILKKMLQKIIVMSYYRSLNYGNSQSLWLPGLRRESAAACV